ncbi:MAG TPA: thiolase family protein [Nitrososphaeraceae archaeon]|jgi:acetyl-CoA C-acetyltransferase
MQRVLVSDYSTSGFRKEAQQSLFEIASETGSALLRHEIVSRNEIDAIIFSSCSSEQYTASILAEMLGIKPKIAVRVDNLCNSGTNAVISGYGLIASGLCKSALIVGAETQNSPGRILSWDVTRGSFALPIYWATMYAKNHMRAYGTTEEQMATVVVKNRKNASKNPNALFRKKITVDEVMKSKRITEPLKLLDCSSLCTGASALLLLSKTMASTRVENPIYITGIGSQTNSASLAEVLSNLNQNGTSKIAARDAYKMANVTPKDIDVAELHDAFSIMEIMAYEDLCFVGRGEGGKFIDQSAIATNPRGGILGCGHALGATGVSQVAEITAQLGDNAGRRQVEGCKTGLIHNLSAAGTSATVLILRAE